MVSYDNRRDAPEIMRPYKTYGRSSISPVKKYLDSIKLNRRARIVANRYPLPDDFGEIEVIDL